MRKNYKKEELKERFLKTLIRKNGYLKQSLISFCREIDIKFYEEIYDCIRNELNQTGINVESVSKIIILYMKTLSLPQFSNYEIYVENRDFNDIRDVVINTEVVKEALDNLGIEEESNLYFLNNELEQLKECITKARERNDIGTYKNLIKAYTDVLALINKEEEKNEWKQMYSTYKNIDNGELQVAVWEQNNSNNIRNHKVFNVKSIPIA